MFKEQESIIILKGLSFLLKKQLSAGQGGFKIKFTNLWNPLCSSATAAPAAYRQLYHVHLLCDAAANPFLIEWITPLSNRGGMFQGKLVPFNSWY